MATRANVLVKSVGLDFPEPCILLYHHYDGYPEYMLPTMLNYEKIFKKEVKQKLGIPPEKERWVLGRVSHLASFIIATDILGFEISRVFEREEDVVLHSDIDFYYVITAHNSKWNTAPQIWIEVYTSLELEEPLLDQFWETGDPKLLKKIFSAPFTKKEVQKFLEEY
jgi:hypothetical protein